MSLAGCAYGFDDDYSTTIREENKQLRAENERLKAELAEAKKDAERKLNSKRRERNEPTD